MRNSPAFPHAPVTLAVRPPEYFPGAATAALLLAADRVVLADTFPFSRQGAHNRARIRTSPGAGRGEGWEWLSVPRRHGGVGRPLLSIGVDDAAPWATRHRRALHVNYAMAPYYEHHADALDALLGPVAGPAPPWVSLAELTVATVAWLHRALGAASELAGASALPGAPAALDAVWDALAPPDAATLLTLADAAERDAARLAGRAEVRVLAFEEPARAQVFPGFVPGTSALDLVLNHGPRAADLLRGGMGV